MATADAKYTLDIKATVTKDGEDSPMWRVHSEHLGLNYGTAVGIQQVLQNSNQEVLDWGKALAASLGQPVPSDLAPKSTGKK